MKFAGQRQVSGRVFEIGRSIQPVTVSSQCSAGKSFNLIWASKKQIFKSRSAANCCHPKVVI